MIFKSKYREHRLVMTPDRAELTNAGRKIVRGKSIQFKEFLYETEDEKEIKFLKKHAQFGVTIVTLKSKEEQEDDILARAEEIKKNRAEGGEKSDTPEGEGGGSLADQVEAAAAEGADDENEEEESEEEEQEEEADYEDMNNEQRVALLKERGIEIPSDVTTKAGYIALLVKADQEEEDNQ